MVKVPKLGRILEMSRDFSFEINMIICYVETTDVSLWFRMFKPMVSEFEASNLQATYEEHRIRHPYNQL
jgi:hypothetical protein